MSIEYRASGVAQCDPVLLYRLLWLRVSVFVVEQQAAYAELDGRDVETGAELLWAEEGDEVLATLRILRDTDGMRIGRVATAPGARGRGVASELMVRAVARCEQALPGAPIRLDAQEHLARWYGRFGFLISGAPFLEDGIPHVPMARVSSKA